MANEALKNIGRDAGVQLTPQSQKAAKGQKKNSAGGYTFVVSPLDLAKRFLILGSDASYYDSAAKLTKQSADNLVKLIERGQSKDLVDLIVEISTAGRAPKQQPGLFALAVAATHGTAEERHYAYSKLNAVARTASTLFTFVGYVTQFQRIGMGTQKAIRRWYAERSTDNLALQMVKYQSRDGFSHADLFKLARPKSDDAAFNALAQWALRGEVTDATPALVEGFEVAKAAPSTEIGDIVRKYGLSWEMVPSEALNRKQTWDALMDVNLPLGALLRNLPKLTNVGVIAPLGGRTNEIVDRLTDQEAIQKSRLHPLNILVALKTYAAGKGLKGSQVWQPVQQVVDALDAAFYLAFPNVEATGQRYLLANDVSGSMDWEQVAGAPLTPREAVGALSLVIQRTERDSHIIGFTGYAGGSYNYGLRSLRGSSPGLPKAGASYYSSAVTPIDISPKMRLDDVTKKMRSLPMGSTDCALPMLYAIEQGLEVDTFVVLTDNDTWAGTMHAHEALKLYRKESGINSKLIVLATKGDKFTIADPKDPGMLDIAGFDTAVPQIVAEFSRDI